MPHIQAGYINAVIGGGTAGSGAFAPVIPTLQAKQCDVIVAQLYLKPGGEGVVDFVPYVYSGTGFAVSNEKPAAVTGLAFG